LVAVPGGGNAVIAENAGNEYRATRVTIREETGADAPEIATLTRAVFGGEYEVSLVEKLHATRLVIVSLVSVEESVVVGHILFSKLSVEVDQKKVVAAALAAMAVRLDR
jgi:putative acetyltransferase